MPFLHIFKGFGLCLIISFYLWGCHNPSGTSAPFKAVVPASVSPVPTVTPSSAEAAEGENANSELVCAVQLVGQGTVAGNVVVKNQCETVLDPSEVAFSSVEIERLVRLAHTFLATNDCQQSLELYQRAYGLETAWGAKGYLAQRIEQSRQCVEQRIQFHGGAGVAAAALQTVQRESAQLYDETRWVWPEGDKTQTFQQQISAAQQAVVERQCSQASQLYQQLLAAPQITAALQAFLQSQSQLAEHCQQALAFPFDASSPLPTASPTTPIVTPTPFATSTPRPSSTPVGTGAATGSAPLAPQGLHLQQVTHRSAHLAWSAFPEAEAYQIYVNDQREQIVTRPFAFINALSAGSAHTVKVSAVINSAETAASQPLSVVTLPEPESRNFNLQIRAYESLKTTVSSSLNTLVLKDHYVLLGADQGLVVLDTRQPSQPLLVSELSLSTNVRGIQLRDHLAYLATAQGLVIVDVTNPTALSVKATLPLGSAYALQLKGDHVYVATLSGLHVVQVTDPTAPAKVGGYETAATARGLVVQGNRAYLTVNAATAGKFLILDLAEPASPQLLGEYALNSANDVAVHDGVAYVISNQSGLHVLDITNPAQPLLQGALADIATGQRQNIMLAPPRAYVWGSSGLSVINIANAAQPAHERVLFHSSVTDLVFHDGKMYLSRRGGFDIMDNTGHILNSFLSNSSPHDVEVVGNYAYVGDNAGGLRIFDIAAPTQPVQISYITLGQVHELRVVGDYAYVTAKGDGLKIVNISNPRAPFVVATYMTLAGQSGGLSVVGNLVYIADNPGGIQIIDVSNPSQPVWVGQHVFSEAWGVDVVGPYAYVASYQNGLTILDVSNPQNPVVVGHHSIWGEAWEVQVVGDLAYVVGGQGSGLQIINVENPAKPYLVGVYRPDNLSVLGVHVVGKYAYLASSNKGFLILDVSNPADIKLEKEITQWGGLGDVGGLVRLQVVGKYAYLAGKTFQIVQLD